MIWVVLAAVGVPLWLVMVGLLLVLRSRRRLQHQPGVFACRLRSAGPFEESDWPRTKSYAYWVHDVLLVHRGAALKSYDALPVSNVIGPVEAATAKRLGERPVRVRLHLDDGRLIDVAMRKQDEPPATGPFVAASMK